MNAIPNMPDNGEIRTGTGLTMGDRLAARSSAGWQGQNAHGFDPATPMGEDNRLPGQHYFDPTVRTGLIDAQAGRGENYFNGVSNYKVGDTSAIPSAHSNDPMTQAIQAKYSKLSANATQALIAQNKANAPVQASSEAAKASKELGAVYQNQVQNYQQQKDYQLAAAKYNYQRDQQLEDKKDGLIGGVLGGALAIFGGVFGGPSGAEAGQKAGQGLGGLM